MQCLSLVRAFGWHYRLDSHEYARARCFTCPNTRRRCSSSYLESFREQNASVTAVHFACTCILARSRLFSLLFLSLWLARRIRNKIIPLRARYLDHPWTSISNLNFPRRNSYFPREVNIQLRSVNFKSLCRSSRYATLIPMIILDRYYWLARFIRRKYIYTRSWVSNVSNVEFGSEQHRYKFRCTFLLRVSLQRVQRVSSRAINNENGHARS